MQKIGKRTMLALCFAFCLVLAITAGVSAASSGKCGHHLTWTLGAAGALTITGSGEMENYSWYGDVPWFNSRDKIKTVSIGNGVTSVGNYSFFDCSNLTSVTIPNSVTSIGNQAFEYCTSLTDVTIPNSVISVGNGVFWHCTGLTKVTISDSVTSIGNFAFSSCTSLTDVTIPNSVTSIRDWTFKGCANLTDVTIPNSVTSIGGHAFEGCSNLTDVTIPNSVTSIGAWAFSFCASLTNVTIPNSVTSIGGYAFKDCPNLTIYGKSGSFAETYAKANNIPFEAVRFLDVNNSNAYYYTAVAWAVDYEPQITNGTNASYFSPNATCTRNQVVTFLWRAKGCPEPSVTENPFSDVKASDYFYKAVLWAVEEGVTEGITATTFGPKQGCTRGQVVTFLHRAEGKPAATGQNVFTDVKADAYYYDAVLWAVGKDITKGTDATHFSPDKTCTRGQIVTFLYRDLAK